MVVAVAEEGEGGGEGGGGGEWAGSEVGPDTICSIFLLLFCKSTS